MKKNSAVALTFLQWFKIFFDENNDGREYNALEARGGQSLVPADLGVSRTGVTQRVFRETDAGN